MANAEQGIGEIPVKELEKERSNPSILSSKKPFFIIAVLLVILIPLLVFLKTTNKLTQSTQKPQSFSLSESSPEDFDDMFPVVGQPTFVFAKKVNVSEKELSKYFKIEPSVSGSWHLEKNGQVVYFSSNKKGQDSLSQTFAYNTVYKITIDSALTGSDGKQLKNTQVISFKTAKNPNFPIVPEKKLISVLPSQKIQATFFVDSYQNGSSGDQSQIKSLPVEITTYTATPTQLLSYLVYKKDKNPLYNFVPTKTNKVISKIKSSISSSPTQSSYALDIPPLQNSGLYVVVVKNEFGAESFFISAGTQITQVFPDQDSMYSWTTDQNGNTVVNTTSEFYSLRNGVKKIGTSSSNRQGIVELQKNTSDIDLVLTTNGTFTTFTKTAAYEQRVERSYQIYSYSDRPVYHPGDTVHYKAVIRQKDKGTYSLASGKMYVKFLEDYADNTNDYQELSIDDSGTITYDLKLPPLVTVNYQVPQIILATKNGDGTYNQINTLFLNVQAYRKPDMELDATTQKTEYISLDEAKFVASGQTLFGTPLSNVPFTYRVLINDYTEIQDRGYESFEDQVNSMYGQGQELTSGKGTFDKMGKANIDFSTDLQKYEQSQIATLEITPQIGASPSIGKSAILIHRGEFAIFFNYEDLKSDTKNGISGSFVTMNQENPRRIADAQDLSVSLYKIDSQDYQKKNLVEKQDVTQNDQRQSSFTFPKVDVGSYELLAQGKDSRGNTVSTRYSVYVSEEAAGQVATGQQLITLKTDKKTYKPGETATISVTANEEIKDAVVVTTTFSGTSSLGFYSSLITSFSKQSVNNKSLSIPLKIPKDQVQNMSVAVATVQDGTVVIGSEYITIENAAKEVSVDITFDKKITKPGELVSATITTKDQKGNPVSADTSFAVIDAAILQIGQNQANIFDTFYKNLQSAYVNSFDSTQGIYTYSGGGGGGCFLKGTPIRMSDGTEKNIEDVVIGDKILTRSSEFSSTLTEDTVTKTYRHVVSEYLTINDKLQVTPIHRLFVNNSWKQAKDIQIGDHLLDEYGNPILVETLDYSTGQFVVYNLTVFNAHTFFANGVYVHNDKGVGPRNNFADTVYWNPHLQTNNQGKASVTFKTPDNLTTYSSFAVSNTKDSLFGQNAVQIISKKDVTLTPTIPNFYYQGDKPVLSLLAQNNSDEDLETVVTSTIKETNQVSTQDLSLTKGDLNTVSFPVEIPTEKDMLSFQFELKDKTTGKILDSVLVKKPILPKAAITANWSSFTGSNTVEFSPTYPSLDFNTIQLIVIPHITQTLTKNPVTMDSYVYTRTGEQLYVSSYLLNQTQQGILDPSSYKYAKLRNDFRSSTQSLISQKNQTNEGVSWISPNGTDSQIVTSAWIVLGLESALQNGQLQDFTGLKKIITDGKRHLSNYGRKIGNGISPNSSLNTEAILIAWAQNDVKSNLLQNKSVEALAVKTLLGDTQALSDLRQKRIESASDRYFWSGNSEYGSTLASLAMIEKGTTNDQEKTARGISTEFNSIYPYDNPLALLVGIKDLVKRNAPLQEAQYTVTVNGKTAFEITKDTYSPTFTGIYSPKNAENKKISISVQSKNSLPLYGMVVKTEYKNETKTFSFFTPLQLAKIASEKLERKVKDLGNDQTKAVILLGKSPYTTSNSQNTPSMYTVLLTDALSPAVTYLDQSSGNSPQFQNALSDLFPNAEPTPSVDVNGVPYANQPQYMAPANFSDEAVFFNNIASLEKDLIFPYVTYTISKGSYYQPKTQAVFPYLGVIIEEK